MGNRASRCLHCLPDMWIFPDRPFPSLLLKTYQQETPPGRNAASFIFPAISTHRLDNAAWFWQPKPNWFTICALQGELMPNFDRKTHSALLVIIAGLLLAGPARASAATCESLATLKLPATTITSAQQVAAGAFTSPYPAEPGAPPLGKNLPAFCR